MGGQMLPPFGWRAVATQWAFAPVVTGLVLISAVLYLEGAWRVARRHPARPWPWWRTGMFLAGLAVLMLATESGVGVYSDVLFWDHMVQHLLLIMVAPALLVAGAPLTLLLHASRNPVHTWAKRALRSRAVSALTSPPFGIVAYTAAIVGTHLSGVMSRVMTNGALHDGERALYLVVGFLFFLPLLGREPVRWRLSYPVQLILLFLVMPVDTFAGLMLTYSSTPMAGMGPRPSWAPGGLSDLHAGGAVMWVGGDGIMFVLMMLVFLAWARDGQASSLRRGGWLESARQASFAALTGLGGAASPGGGTRPSPPVARDSTIDDDEHLAAYNDFLARINAAERQRAAESQRAAEKQRGEGRR